METGKCQRQNIGSNTLMLGKKAGLIANQINTAVSLKQFNANDIQYYKNSTSQMM